MTLPQWSRPGTGSEPGTPFLFIRGVRPNSPITITIVESSRPRRSRSSISVPTAASRIGQHAMHPLVEARVEVPAAEGQGHEPHARLDQPAGQQGALPPLVSRVAIAEPRVFLAQVEGPRADLAQDQGERLLLETVEAVADAPSHRGRGGPARRRPAGCGGPPSEAHRRRPARIRLGTWYRLGVGIAVGVERVVRRPEIGRPMIAGRDPDRVGVRQADIRRHPRLLGPLEPGDDRTRRRILRRHVDRVRSRGNRSTSSARPRNGRRCRGAATG